jgi:hypothetical protein
MEAKHKVYLKLNLMSLVFIVVSFISVTLAWFAYSGLADVKTEVGVKAWYIELNKDGKPVSNEIVISLSDIYPGMETSHEMINIKNLGDSDAQLKYSIESARVLGDLEDNFKVTEGGTESAYIEDVLSHKYPFHINMNMEKNYILSKQDDSDFEVSVSWPLDSGDDAFDSLWGTKAYQFQKSEQGLQTTDPTHQIRPSIQVVIKITAEQYLENDTTSDPKYNLGDVVLYDPVNNKGCSEIGSSCIATYVIDRNNTLGDKTVTLMPNPKNTYVTGGFSDYNTLLSNVTSNWTVASRGLTAGDIMNVVSADVMNTNLVKAGISNIIVGNLKYGDRMNIELAKASNLNAYYSYKNNKFTYLSTANCYWTSTEYNASLGYAAKKIDDDSSKVYGEPKEISCNIVPVIIADKANIKSNMN